MSNDEMPAGFDELLEYLKQSRGFDFTGYKRASLRRRIDKRMRTVDLDDYDRYLDYLQVHPYEFDALFNSILINVTGFFRDPATWAYLREEVLPAHLDMLPSDSQVRAWVAGCASGEEAYTVAIILAELLGEENFARRVKIYGTDVDEDALQRARLAAYNDRDISGVPENLREKYFERNGERFAFRSDLRRSVIFGRIDVLHDAPISRLDLLTCRNTLMYFNADTQAQVIERFSFALKDNAVLVLGKAETLLSRSSIFEPIDRKRRVFRKVARRRGAERAGEVFAIGSTDGAGSDGNELYRATLIGLPVPVLLFGPEGMLVDANESARQRFGVTQRDIGSLVQDLDISYRPVDLRTPITEALTERRVKELRDTPWSMDGSTAYYDITTMPMLAGAHLLGVAVMFEDTSHMRDLEDRLEHSTLEVEQAYQELQSTNEELETTNEELQSTIEELETTNEELQSTNEELETMNEELQSTNDELYTVNEEVRLRGDEVDQLNHFLQAVFTSFGGGVAVVDTERRIRVWNPQAADLWGIREDEVQGSDVLHLDIGLPVAKLARPLEACLAGAGDQSATVAAVTRRGRSVSCRVTLTPLLVRGTVDGALIVMEILPDD